MSPALSLVADIGGTNTRVALAHGKAVDGSSVRRYANREASGLDEVLHRYLSDTDTDRGQITGACVAAAGPVHDGVAELTNLPWRIDRNMLTEILSADKVAVLNDLQAQGHAIGHLAPDMITQILPQPKVSPRAAKLVVGVGTGFNAAPIYDTAQGRFVPPSECGHMSLPPCGPDSAVLTARLRDTHGFAAVEEALSGRGIEAIHTYLHDENRPAAEIMAALEAGNSQAEGTARLFVRVLGTVIGDLALIHLPFGGIHLVGGVNRAFAPYLHRFGFAAAMHDKGRFGPFLEQFGVAVVSDDYAALTGCASHLVHL
ncbi:ROK family protein [Rhodophyticola sp. CCM32]|uniref:glucokinase n=1 Tax=Rhodophyticola sp. CCM32 TaxID=2916397 RepID=UPI00107F76E6|nr:ROK family protein [Rhodophyticola sp. CCM32]QBY00644.1 ROK family protein [Rhodophyticola sp. CCM32]